MLEVSGLCAGYGRIPILTGITFTLSEGEIVGVLGHNGMGKTTLLRTLIGELRATAGSIHLDGTDITRRGMADRARRGLGYVPQGRRIFPRLSVLENLEMGEVARRGRTTIPELLDYFPPLRALLDRPGQALSGGEQQVLALARALAGQPKVLLLDEPTEGIQPSIVEEIEATLKRLVMALNLTVLLVEQDLHFIAALAHRVMIIQRGRIVAQVLPEDLKNRAIVDEYLGI